MDREKVIKLLAYIKVAYPGFYRNLTKEDAGTMIELYQRAFADCDYNLVSIALEEIINTDDNPYPPTIAKIKNKMYELTTEKKTPSELWNELIKAIRNGNYGAKEEFEKLSDEVKTFVGNPAQLKELASMNSDVINSVTKGQFFKQIEVIQARMKEEKQMLTEARKVRELALCVGQDVNKMLNV